MKCEKCGQEIVGEPAYFTVNGIQHGGPYCKGCASDEDADHDHECEWCREIDERDSE